MSLKRRHGVHNAFINLTPMIDMSLMLVVFFVLCLTTSQAAVRALPVTLPEAASSTAATTTELEVVMQPGGELSVDGKPITLGQLAALAQGRSRAALLADRDCRHGQVVDVVDVLRHAGITDVYFATAKPTAGAGAALQDW
jgi:biopolymer transport protein ExbD